MPLIMPTSPSQGVPSNLLTAQGITDSALVNIGGEVRRGGGYEGQGRTIAGGGRLGRFVGLKPQGEIQKIMDEATKAQLNQYVTERLAEGYKKVNANTLEKDMGGGVKEVLTIDWSTGQLASTNAPTAEAVRAQRDYSLALKSANKQADTQLMFQTLGPVDFWKDKASKTKDPGLAQQYLAKSELERGRVLQSQVQEKVATGYGQFIDSAGLGYSYNPDNINKFTGGVKINITPLITSSQTTTPKKSSSSGRGGGGGRVPTLDVIKKTIGLGKGPIIIPTIPTKTPVVSKPSYKDYFAPIKLPSTPTKSTSTFDKYFSSPAKDFFSKGRIDFSKPKDAVSDPINNFLHNTVRSESNPVMRFLNSEIPRKRRR